MTKEVLFGKESRTKILAGVQKITDAVRVTMGAMGKCVLIGEAAYGNNGLVFFPTKVSKDGYTVTKYFELPDAVENRGAMMIKEAATKTVEQAGDATTCTCVLAESLITNGMKLIDEGANSQELKKGMDKALVYVIEELKKISIPVKGDSERIRQVATVSANNDASIGDLIAKAYEKIGDEGIIDIEASQSTNTEIKITDGYRFDRSWISPLFITNKEKQVCEFLDPLILLYDKRILHHAQIKRALEKAIPQNRPILIICEDADEEGLAFLAMNNINPQVNLRCCVVKAPSFGDGRREEMEDIAMLTGGTYISDITGISLKDDIELHHFGQAKKVFVTKEETRIIEGKSDKETVDNVINELRMNLTQAKTEDEKYAIEKRIARLKGGVAVIQVGAATETELNEKLDRVDDAVRATKAAISEGFVAGGGTAFLRCLINIKMSEPENIAKGILLLVRSLNRPLIQICENAGVDSDNILQKIGASKGNIGYDALTGEIVDMVEAGIIDSTKALRCALTNAVSVAGMVLTSECSIITTA